MLDKGWRPLWELLGTFKPCPRFCSFLRPFPPNRPQEFPAAFIRLPLSMYSEFGLVYRADAPREAFSKLSDMVRRCARCDTHDLKTVGGSAVKLRGELCEYILSSNYKVARPFNGRERDLCHWFPSQRIRSPRRGGGALHRLGPFVCHWQLLRSPGRGVHCQSSHRRHQDRLCSSTAAWHAVRPHGCSGSLCLGCLLCRLSPSGKLQPLSDCADLSGSSGATLCASSLAGLDEGFASSFCGSACSLPAFGCDSETSSTHGLPSDLLALESDSEFGNSKSSGRHLWTQFRQYLCLSLLRLCLQLTHSTSQPPS